MDQSNKHNTDCYIEHLLCFVVTTSTQGYLLTNSKQLNRDNGTQALIDEIY